MPQTRPDPEDARRRRAAEASQRAAESTGVITGIVGGAGTSTNATGGGTPPGGQQSPGQAVVPESTDNGGAKGTSEGDWNGKGEGSGNAILDPPAPRPPAQTSGRSETKGGHGAPARDRALIVPRKKSVADTEQYDNIGITIYGYSEDTQKRLTEFLSEFEIKGLREGVNRSLYYDVGLQLLEDLKLTDEERFLHLIVTTLARRDAIRTEKKKKKGRR